MAEEQRVRSGFIIRSELLGILGLLVIQTFGAIWWASGVSTTLSFMKSEMARLNGVLSEYKADRSSEIKEIRLQLDTLNMRIATVEAKQKK